MKKIIYLVTFLFSIHTIQAESKKVCVQLDSTKNKRIFYIGAVVNYNNGTINLGTNRALKGASLNNFSSIGGGISLELQNQKGIFFQTELTYDKRTATDEQFVSLVSNPFASNLSVNFSYVNIPIIGGYIFKGKELAPFIGGGIHVGFSTTNEIRLNFPDDTPSYVLSNSNPNIVYDESAEYGIIGTIGIQKNMNDKGLFKIAANYMGSERTYSINRGRASGGAVNLGTKRLSIAVSYLLYL